MADASLIQTIFFIIVEHVLALFIIGVLLWRIYRFATRHRRLPFAVHLRRHASSSSSFPVVHSPLHPSLFKLLPTVAYSADSRRPPPECAICLTEFREGEIGRVLPNCDHLFHLVCIDEWLRSNKSCPLCRKVVKPPPNVDLPLPPPIWCSMNTITTTRDALQLQSVAIDIPEENLQSTHTTTTSSGD